MVNYAAATLMENTAQRKQSLQLQPFSLQPSDSFSAFSLPLTSP